MQVMDCIFRMLLEYYGLRYSKYQALRLSICAVGERVSAHYCVDSVTQIDEVELRLS